MEKRGHHVLVVVIILLYTFHGKMVDRMRITDF